MAHSSTIGKTLDQALRCRQIDRLKPVLLVIDAGETTNPTIRDLLASMQRDLLLVRQA